MGGRASIGSARRATRLSASGVPKLVPHDSQRHCTLNCSSSVTASQSVGRVYAQTAQVTPPLTMAATVGDGMMYASQEKPINTDLCALSFVVPRLRGSQFPSRLSLSNKKCRCLVTNARKRRVWLGQINEENGALTTSSLSL